MFEVFYRFLLLGCMSFGGPIAHIGYFHKEFVNRRKWLTEETFSSSLSLCQFLPGPASSQLGMYIGYQKAGALGAFAAFVGFTLPSFSLLTLAAIYSSSLQNSAMLMLLISSAKLLAAIVVADAILSMGKKFILDKATLLICIFSTAWLIWQSGVLVQLLAIFFAGSLGWLLSTTKQVQKIKVQHSQKYTSSYVLLSIFLAFLIIPIFLDFDSSKLFLYFYQAGSFVFGGGHVVLPLLEPMVGSFISNQILLEAYAAAQLIPGPMFTIASFLGASVATNYPVLTSLLATVAIFLPGALLLFAALPLWQSVMKHEQFANSVKLINAAVVGLLIAAFYQPVLTFAISSVIDMILVVIGLILLRKYNLSVFVLLLLTLAYSFANTL